MKKEHIKSILNDISRKYLAMEIDEEKVQVRLIEELDPEEIYEIEDDMVITDCFFALKHLNETGYETSHTEIEYFVECFSGIREYNLEEKNKAILQKAGQN